MSASAAISEIVVASKPRLANSGKAATSIARRVCSFFRSRCPMSRWIVSAVAFSAFLHPLHFCADCDILRRMRHLASFSYDRRRLVAAAWVLAIVLAGILAGLVGSGYHTNFTLPGTESQRALDLLEHRFPQQSGDASQIVFHADRGSLKDRSSRAQVERVVRSVTGLPGVAGVVSPYDGKGAISRDGRTAFATLMFNRQAVDL